MSKIIVGLDIGTTKIACFIGQRAENGKLRILGHGRTESIGVTRGVVIQIVDTANSIRKAVAEASHQANYQVEEVYVGIAGQHIKSSQTTGSIVIPSNHSMVTAEDVDRLIEEQYHMMLPPGEEIVHIFPQRFFIDNTPLSEELSPVGVNAKCLSAQFHVVTCNTENLKNIRMSVEQAGLKIKDVVLEPIASSYAVLNKLDRDAGVALVDIGGGTSDIAVFTQDVIRHTSVIPLAGNSITEDIRKGCSILKGQAESLKVKFGSCLPSLESADDIISIPGIRNQPAREISMKTLAGIIKARLNVILEQVAYEVERSGVDKQLLAGIVLTGGGAKMNHIQELSELVTKISSRIGTPDEHLVDADDELAHPMYATAIGLVLFGLDKEEREAEPEPEVENEVETEKAESTESIKDPFDIFDGITSTPTPAPAPAPASVAQPTTPTTVPEKPVDEGVGKNPNPDGGFKKLTAYLTKFFTEGQDQSDNE